VGPIGRWDRAFGADGVPVSETVPRWPLAYAGLWLLATAGMSYLIVPTSVLQLVMTDFAIGPAAAGWLVSVMFGVQAVASTPTGIGLDRVDNRRAIGAAALLLVAGGAAGWWAASRGAFDWLLLTRAVGGLGLVLAWNAGTNVVSRVSVESRRASLLGVYTASAPAGFALGHLTGPTVANRFGWPAVFLAYLPFVLLGLGLFLAGSASLDLSGGGEARARFADFRRVLLDRTVWHVAALGFAIYSLYVFANSWLPTFLAERLELSLTASGLAVALFPAVGIVSRSAGGVLADRAFGGRRRPVLLLSFLLSAPAFVVMGFVTVPVAVLLALVLGGLAIQLGIGLLYAYVRTLVAPNVEATAIAFLTAVSVLGSFSAPLVGGVLIERTGSYVPAFGYVGCVLVAGLVLAWLAPGS
jgi:predicted MFS family arabinose efflux permease